MIFIGNWPWTASRRTFQLICSLHLLSNKNHLTWPR